ncbi:hypothetical protein GX831_02110 [bacterium]|jgi:hypothetical protein|nr:hypothetical protein [bacterium]
MSYRVKIILLMQFCVSIFMICVSYFLDRKAKIISRLLKIERYSEIIYNSENKTFDADGKLLSLVKTKILYQIFKNEDRYDCDYKKEVIYYVRDASGELVQSGEPIIEKGTLTPNEYLKKVRSGPAIGLRIFTCVFRDKSFSYYINDKENGVFTADIRDSRTLINFWDTFDVGSVIMPIHIEAKYKLDKVLQIIINYGDEKDLGTFEQIATEVIDFQ